MKRLLFLPLLLVFVSLAGQVETGRARAHHKEVAASWFSVLDSIRVGKIQDNGGKLSPRLARRFIGRAENARQFLVRAQDLGQLKRNLSRNGPSIPVIREYPAAETLLLLVSWEELVNRVLQMQEVVFIDLREGTPREERAVPDFDLSANKVSWLHARHPELAGQGFGVSVKEYRLDSADIDLRGRYLPSGIATNSVTDHATTMATMIAGGGNSFYTGKGVAWQASLASSSFFNLFPDDPAYFESSGLSVQNHSYGLGIENYYGAEAFEYDRQVFEHPTLAHVFSAGNQGDSTSAAGPYAGVTGFANLTGTFKMGKNVLTVGSVDSFLVVATRSSRGPAYDGRVKPELVAFGIDGSSGAAALTSGVATLLQQAYGERYAGELPPVALLRAVLLNSADDLGTPGPDFISGYGNLNAKKAVETMLEDRFRSGWLEEGETRVFSLEVPEDARQLKVTLAWTDPPAALNADKALVNDLDLSLEEAATGIRHSPWVLNDFPHPDSLLLPAVRRVDRLNNQEQITIDDPVGGGINIEVRAHQLSQGPQRFFVAFEWETAGQFEWTFPTRAAPLIKAKSTLLRWESTAGAGTGLLEYAFIGSPSWKEISAAADLGASGFNWALPDTSGLAQLRMTTASGAYLSDTFAISAIPELNLALECGDSLLLTWNEMNAVDSFQVFYPGDIYLQPAGTTADSFLLIDEEEYPGRFYAVAPVIAPGWNGMRSRALNVDFQAAGCYCPRKHEGNSSKVVYFAVRYTCSYALQI